MRSAADAGDISKHNHRSGSELWCLAWRLGVEPFKQVSLQTPSSLRPLWVMPRLSARLCSYSPTLTNHPNLPDSQLYWVDINDFSLVFLQNLSTCTTCSNMFFQCQSTSWNQHEFLFLWNKKQDQTHLDDAAVKLKQSTSLLKKWQGRNWDSNWFCGATFNQPMHDLRSHSWSFQSRFVKVL